MNPLATQGGSSINSNSPNIFNLISMLKRSNPESVAKELMLKNPSFASFMQKNNGKNPFDVAKEYGIDLKKYL